MVRFFQKMVTRDDASKLALRLLSSQDALVSDQHQEDGFIGVLTKKADDAEIQFLFGSKEMPCEDRDWFLNISEDLMNNKNFWGYVVPQEWKYDFEPTDWDIPNIEEYIWRKFQGDPKEQRKKLFGDDTLPLLTGNGEELVSGLWKGLPNCIRLEVIEAVEEAMRQEAMYPHGYRGSWSRLSWVLRKAGAIISKDIE